MKLKSFTSEKRPTKVQPKQPQPFGVSQHHPHRKGLPSCPPRGACVRAWPRAGPEGLKVDVGIRALDGGDDGGQAVVGVAPPGSAEDGIG